TGYAEKLIGGNFKEDVVVFDQNIITSQGPATPYPFAYKIAEVLGKDTAVLRERMLYNFAGGR
ncbi:TPA: DJ-1 family protein, partial [Streptococcus suis 93A]|nr:DJ-1 family protein [Streptococcus suis 93A]HEM4082531.1 DJ-1 family protein [Streptococcus suis]